VGVKVVIRWNRRALQEGLSVRAGSGRSLSPFPFPARGTYLLDKLSTSWYLFSVKNEWLARNELMYSGFKIVAERLAHAS